MRHVALALFLSLALACAETAPPVSRAASVQSAATSKPLVPKDLRRLESHAEDAGEAAGAKQWDKCLEHANGLKAIWPELKARLISDGVSESALQAVDTGIASLTQHVAARNVRDVEIISNVLGGSIANLFDLYLDTVPSDVLRLDVAFRRAQIGSEYSDWVAMSASVEDASRIWTRLRTTLPSGADKVRQQVDEAVIRARRAVEAKDLPMASREVGAILELVDDVERAFKGR